jgi:ABC-type transport system involved in multi-copper enzyme maturation permease subunit
VAFFCFGGVDFTSSADAMAGGTLGRRLFETWLGVQLAVVVPLAPLLVATAVQEERDAGTFDLLLLSGLNAPQVLWGQVASRLLSTLAVLAGGLPVLAIVVSFGGISPWEVINTAGALLAVALALGSVGGFFALFARTGPILPALAAMAWALLAWGVLPAWRVGLAPDLRVFSTIVPLAAPFEATPLGLLAIPAAFPPVALSALLGVPVFRILLTDDSDEELGLRSPDIWVLERFRLWLGAGLVLVVVFTPIGWYCLMNLQFVAPIAVEAVSWVWGLVLEAVGTLAFLLGAVWLYERLTWLRGLFGRRTPLDAPPPSIRFNPVWWREARSSAMGGVRWLVWIAGGTGVVLVASYLLFFEKIVRDVGYLPITIGVFVVGAHVAPLVAALHQIEERRARTLPMLLVTVLSPTRIALGKLAAVWTRIGPWIAIGVMFWVLQPPFPRTGSYLGRAIGGYARLALGTAWYAAFVTALVAATQALALRVPTPRAAWVTTAGLYVAVPLLFSLPEVLDLDRDLSDLWIGLWVPVLDEHAWRDGGIPVALAIGAVWMAAVAAAATRWLIYEISRFRRDLD